ncbi:MAG: hypothetical protein OHK93_003332 [Ramalina farinacea]|uniref:Uncharacterized protein n=1 Tax=Ramalina farinacea TaxID=258253 RepID=A0AA43TZQ4_9LECA|nr:hypothetical protein [Ramalina farinacea]
MSSISQTCLPGADEGMRDQQPDPPPELQPDPPPELQPDPSPELQPDPPPDPHRRAPDTTVSMTAVHVPVREQSEIAGGQQDDGFDLDKVYDVDEIAKVKDFPVDNRGKRTVEEIWVNWTPLYLTRGARYLVEKRYGPVQRKVLTQKNGVRCYRVEFAGSWETAQGVRSFG